MIKPLLIIVLVLLAMALWQGPKLRRWLDDRRAMTRVRKPVPLRPLPPPPSSRDASDDEIAQAERRIAALALPSVELESVPGPPQGDGSGTRIGGPAWLADGEEWPQSSNGDPMEFVAQIDFARLPPLADYPERGLLQFFVARIDTHGADFDHPDRSDCRVVWRPDGADSGGRLVPQPPLRQGQAGDTSPFDHETVRAKGVALAGHAGMRRPGWDSPGVQSVLDGMDLQNTPQVDFIIDGLFEQPENHFIGGHPMFTQTDFRTEGIAGLDVYDRVLLHLVSEDGLIWGDCGFAMFMVRREDLLARRFDRVAFYWDCT